MRISPNRIKRILNCLFSVLVMISVIDAFAAGEKKYVVIAAESWGEPLIKYNSDHKPEGGLIYDFVDLVFNEAKLTYTWLPQPRSRIELALLSGKGDFRVNFSPAWSEKPELHDYSRATWTQKEVIIQRDGSDPIKSIKDLAGKKLIAVRGYFYPSLEEDFKESRIQRLNAVSQDGVYDMLEAGRAEYGISNEFSIIYYLSKNKASKLRHSRLSISENDIFMAVKKGHNQMELKKINKAIDQLRKNGSLEKLMSKYR